MKSVNVKNYCVKSYKRKSPRKKKAKKSASVKSSTPSINVPEKFPEFTGEKTFNSALRKVENKAKNLGLKTMLKRIRGNAPMTRK